MQKEIAGLTRQRISEALFLIGFGVVWAVNWWWPGLLVAFGVSWSASLYIQKRYWGAAVVAVLLCAVPIAYSALVAWEGAIPFLVIGLGATGIARAAYLRPEG
jgi:hypothetical protein